MVWISHLNVLSTWSKIQDNNKALCVFEKIQDRNKAMMFEFVVGGMSWTGIYCSVLNCVFCFLLLPV